ncbi:MAG: 4-hydroxyphenylacetate 3-monooxygenase, oxygenase component [Sporolactobacillus sp.]
MTCIDGRTYLDRINGLHNNVWINGKQILGKLSDHPAYKGAMASQAKLYDFQQEQAMLDLLTYRSPQTGKRVAMSYLEPKTKEDLARRSRAFHLRARKHAGMMGRSPDYMNTVVMTFAACADLFADSRGTQNMRRYYAYCQEHDISLTHTFIQPQVNRSAVYFENANDAIAARMIEKDDQGIVIHGARLLATQGGMTDEIMVFPTGAFHFDQAYAYAFCIPSNTPGLKFVARESFDDRKNTYDHPLTSRFEEIDSVVIFDHVKVPWDRVFLHGDTEIAGKLYGESGFIPHQVHHVTTKNIVKTEFILGTLQSMIDAINIGEYQHIQEKMSEIIINLETLKALLAASEAQAARDQWGTMTPDRKPLMAAMNLFSKIYPRFVEIIQLVGASGLISIPGEADFLSASGPELKKYLQSADRDGYEKVKLFRLAWDLSTSAFAGRQTLYERFFFGDPVRLAGTLYREYDRTEYVAWVKEFLDDK